jgi:hypothetical protein
VVGQALSVAIAGAIFIGLGGAAAGASLVAGGASGPSGVSLEGTFMSAMRAALAVSGLLAAAGALTSLSRGRGGLMEVERRDLGAPSASSQLLS